MHVAKIQRDVSQIQHRIAELKLDNHTTKQYVRRYNYQAQADI